MGTAPGQSTPGTQSVPGQTPQVRRPAGGRPERRRRARAGARRRTSSACSTASLRLSVPDWRYADGIPTAAVPAERLLDVLTWLRDESRPALRAAGGRRRGALAGRGTCRSR